MDYDQIELLPQMRCLCVTVYDSAAVVFGSRCVVVENAVRLWTSKRAWICAVESLDDKLNWIALLRTTIKSSLS